MFWNDEQSQEHPTQAQTWLDLAFAIDCKRLPVDHLHALSEALLAIIPNLKEDGIGVHEIHIAGSQNGWERPDPKLGQFLIPSRRTRLHLRVPESRAEELMQNLPGTTLQLAGNRLTLGQAKRKPLYAHDTLYARHVVMYDEEIDDELRFLERMADELAKRGIQVKKALCGKSTQLQSIDAKHKLHTRSLMLADLKPTESLQLLQTGIGEHKHVGCGLFVPMKGIQAVDPEMTN